jgi:uncharacterized protein with NRDE domain
MCLILFAHKVSKKYPFILASNRDEFYHRPTDSMDFWKDHPFILAGRDLEGGGTWFGINKSGRFGAITNYRDPSSIKIGAPSRGKIITDFLSRTTPPCDYLEKLRPKSTKYNGFNLLLGDMEHLYWFSNRENSILKIEPGVHGISNRFINTPWPKVVSGKEALEKTIRDSLPLENLFSILKDRTIPPDAELPDTGISLEWERILSPLFIKSQTYGTRTSTVMRIDNKGTLEIVERTYAMNDPVQFKDKTFIFNPN